MVDYSEAIGLEGFEDINDFSLSAEEQKGVIGILGVVAFCNLAAPGGAPGYEPKYGIDLLAAKGSDDAALVFAAGKHVCAQKWGSDSEREYDIASQIASGFTGRQLNFNVVDGDLVDPEWNGGCWVVKAKNPDPVVILDAHGRIVTAPAQFPGRNWGVRAIIELWASPTKDRLNLRLLAVQGIQAGVRKTGRTPEQTLSIVQGAIARLPALPAGAFGPSQAAPSRAIEAPAAPARPAPRAPVQAQPSPAQAPAPAPARRRAPAPVEPEAPAAAPAPAARRPRRAAPAADPAQFFRGDPAPAEDTQDAYGVSPAQEALAESAPAPRRRRATVG